MISNDPNLRPRCCITGSKYEYYLELTDASKSICDKDECERVFTYFGGERSTKKLKALNMMLIDWQSKSVKKTTDSKTGCPYHKPSTSNNRIRTFIGTNKNSLGGPTK